MLVERGTNWKSNELLMDNKNEHLVEVISFNHFSLVDDVANEPASEDGSNDSSTTNEEPTTNESSDADGDANVEP